MKTPRELLLERHRSIEPKLDVIREEVVAQLEQSVRQGRPPTTESLWNKLIMPLRWHLASLAVLWMVIAVLNTEQSLSRETAARASSTEELVVAMHENRRQLLELTEAADVASPDRLKPALQPYPPRRRSDATPSYAMA